LAGGSSSGSTATGLVVLLLLVGAVVGVRLARTKYRERNKRNALARIALGAKNAGAEGFFTVGSYVAGLGGATGPTVCAIGPDDLVFLQDYLVNQDPGDPGTAAPEIGRIPRDAVEFLAVRDASQTQTHVQVVQRLSVTRLALLGPLALAAPKRNKIETTKNLPKYFLIIDWADRNGIKQETLFQFANANTANSAETQIRAALRPLAQRLTTGAVPQPTEDSGGPRPHPNGRVSNHRADAVLPDSLSRSVADELAKLAHLRDSGVLSQQEFAAEKARLLHRS
jgi:hypothetical protein